jgi:predicted transposase/invertase (TIGR01784 family)
MSGEIEVGTLPEKKEIKNPAIVRRRDDALWKSILEDIFEDFLRFFVPGAEEIFDFSKKFSFLDKEFDRMFPPEDDTKGVVFVDKLVKVYLKNGDSRFILVHVEIQGQKGHEELSLRMFRYFYRAKDKHNVSITAFAVLTDEVKSYHPKIYQEEFLGTKLSYEFNTYKLLEQNEARLRENPNPFAVVVLTALAAVKHKNANDEDLKNIKIDLIKELIKRNINQNKQEKIITFLTRYVNFKNRKNMSKFEVEVEQLIGRETPMGIKEFLLERQKQEGIEIGRQEGKATGIEEGSYKKALAIAQELKKEGLAIEFIARTTKLSVEEIKTLIV